MLLGLFEKAKNVKGLNTCLNKGSELLNIVKETYDLVQKDQERFMNEKPDYEKQNFDELYFKAVANVCNEPTESKIRGRWDVRTVSYVSEQQRMLRKKSVDLKKNLQLRCSSLNKNIKSGIKNTKKRAYSAGKKLSNYSYQIVEPIYTISKDAMNNMRTKSVEFLNKKIRPVTKKYVELPLKQIHKSVEPIMTNLNDMRTESLKTMKDLLDGIVSKTKNGYECATNNTLIDQIMQMNKEIRKLNKSLYLKYVIPIQSLTEKNGNSLYQFVMVWREMFQELFAFNKNLLISGLKNNFDTSKLYISSMDLEIFYSKGKSFKIKKDILCMLESLKNTLKQNKKEEKLKVLE